MNSKTQEKNYQPNACSYIQNICGLLTNIFRQSMKTIWVFLANTFEYSSLEWEWEFHGSVVAETLNKMGFVLVHFCKNIDVLSTVVVIVLLLLTVLALHRRKDTPESLPLKT